ncbi:MAG: hypothetical protein AAFN93_04520 [Bacteroidota bacterium]
MINSFKILFEVSILHHYMLNLGNQDYEGMSTGDKQKQLSQYQLDDIFEISPTEETKLRANGARLLFKNTPTGFLIGSAVDPTNDDKPLIDFTSREKFSFNIYFKDASLFNYSALPIMDNQGAIYHFNNLDKDSFQFPNLVNYPPEFDSSLATAMSGDGDPDTFAYLPGDLLIDDQSDPAEVYEAIRSTNDNVTTVSDWRQDLPAAAYDGATNYLEGDTVLFTVAGKDALYRALADVSGVVPTNVASWAKIVDLPLLYVNREDRIPVQGPIYNYEFGGPGENLTFDILDPSDNVILTETVISSAEKVSHQLDLRGMQTGRFTMRITDNSGATILEEYSFYLQRTPEQKPLFGVIDIYSGDDLADYSLVNGSNEFQSPEYILRFKNRSTVWRYINSQNRDVVHESDFNPLTASGIIDVSFDGSNLPNPGIQIIRPEPTQYYSDIYL